MEMKPALLVVALAAAAVLTAGCEQRGTSDTASKRDTASGSMAQATPPTPPSTSTNTPPGTKVGNAADDAAITAKVKAAILAEPGLKSLQINVDTKDQTVTLSGNVASDQMRDRAKQIAMSTEGVKNVVDNLTVKTS
jgi:osmotically-inducible protein OsmY